MVLDRLKTPILFEQTLYLIYVILYLQTVRQESCTLVNVVLKCFLFTDENKTTGSFHFFKPISKL